MWTKEHRERQKVFERRRSPTDLTDEEWERIRPILPQPARRGRKPKVNLREILNAIRTAGVIDSQTVKAPGAPGGGGYDAAKKGKGRKRHIAVDTDGRLLMVNLTAADIQGAQGAEQIIKAVRQRWPFLKHLFADGAYDRGRLMSQAAYRNFMIEIVRQLFDQKGFQPLPRRWVVERPFGWMTRWRRLVRDDEERCDVSEAMIRVAMRSLMLRRIPHPYPFSNRL